MGSVKVAVRVRPFNQREIELNSLLCVNMSGATTTITDPEDGKTRDFTFDYSFWSHDECESDEAGYFHPISDKYADQKKVFEAVGLEILDNAWQGYHCCLFAYGQTGAGKSYSMIGYGANRGIVPISMQEIFERIKRLQSDSQQYEVMFAMLEIYNEKIQDLLIPMNNRTQGGLKVREHQKLGVYVDGLNKCPVDSYQAIEAKMDEGNRNRTIGSTIMNASSSRAHTIITIEFKKIDIVGGKKTEKFSIINLVDLAGSEKLAKTGATGDRMKEGCAINQSLSSLGIVISKLADKAQGKKNVVVPYRDSVLTRILQNALGGNSKTLMICALSPATDNFDETLSTLRYADQAKKIKNNAVVNESEQDKMIRELKEENDKLKNMLKDFKPGDPRNSVIDEETFRRYKEMEDQLRTNQSLMHEMEKSFAEKLKESKLKEKEEAMVNKQKPHFLNLNEDPLLSAKVLYSLEKPVVYVGRKNGRPTPDIILGGAGIKPNHAKIINDKGDIYAVAIDEDCAEYIYLNGERLTHKKKLQHNDRLIFGTNSIFLFKYPTREQESHNSRLNDHDLDWEFAQKELVDSMNRLKKLQMEKREKERHVEMELKIKQVQEHYKKEKEDIEIAIKKQQYEYEKKIREFEEKMKKETEAQLLEMAKRETEREWKQAYAKYEAERLQKERERERMQKEIQEEAAIKKIREQEKHFLEGALTKFLSKITEVNLIAKELKRNIIFSVKLSYTFISSAELTAYSESEKSHKLKILVENKEQNCRYQWKLSKFSNRYYIIKDILEKFYETNTLPPANNANDPFWDPPEPHLIGQAFLSLQSLTYLIDNQSELSLVGDTGGCGTIMVNIVPLDENGTPLGEGADYIEDPQELIGKKLEFTLSIEFANLPENSCRDTYCEYHLLDSDGAVKDYRTITIQGKNSKPEYNYSCQHSYNCVDQKILNYLLNHYLNIRVYGFETPEDTKENFSPEKNSFQIGQDSEQKPKKRNLEIFVDDPPKQNTNDDSTDQLANDDPSKQINIDDSSKQNSNQQKITTNINNSNLMQDMTKPRTNSINPIITPKLTIDNKSGMKKNIETQNYPSSTTNKDTIQRKKKEDCTIF